MSTDFAVAHMIRKQLDVDALGASDQAYRKRKAANRQAYSERQKKLVPRDKLGPKRSSESESESDEGDHSYLGLTVFTVRDLYDTEGALADGPMQILYRCNCQMI